MAVRAFQVVLVIMMLVCDWIEYMLYLFYNHLVLKYDSMYFPLVFTKTRNKVD